jgi:hypothetical protein
MMSLAFLFVFDRQFTSRRLFPATPIVCSYAWEARNPSFLNLVDGKPFALERDRFSA